ncbi:tRNA-splicing endonuclease subunit Sen34 [Cylas formicarius]|uniref:tRNA-splicing endonuclease subunit Sen34 n=1 Tax=Cylas formicarius TaxID=197179 RepID=UPI0029585277|nr:tRNA-splicing endonuclease subunit Sen34 [Cylas formicarius]
MIKLHFEKGAIFVFDVDDWCEIRNTHRIVGQVVGSTSFIPSLPLKLLPEEAFLLLNKNIATLQEIRYMKRDRERFKIFEQKLLEQQQIEYKQVRKVQLESLIDKIVQNRRKIGDLRSKEEIFEEELEKSSQINRDNMIWPIFLKRDGESESQSLSAEVVCKFTSDLKIKVFRDLWERGYYITNGEKFGGDFLVYFGDPLVYHAVFIVRCIEREKLLTPANLVGFGRLGVSVKKRAVLASISENQVRYLTINWIDA